MDKTLTKAGRLADLLLKKLTGRLETDEQQELQQWTTSGERAERMSRQLADPQFLEEEYRRRKALDTRRAMADMEKRIGSSMSSSVKLGSFTHNLGAKIGSFTHFKNAKIGSFTHYKHGSFRHWLAAAAAVAVLVVGGLYWYWQEMRVIPPVISEQVLAAMEQSKQAGRQEAIIEHTVPLSSPKEGTTAPAHVTNEAPSGAVGGAVAALGEAECVTTRSDKEYWLTLPDGSKVHLNYNTRVIFPEKFIGDSRDVYLEGEAYFMVAKDKRHPFIVHTEQGDVKVYGTEFNVCTRGGESGKWKEESGKRKEEYCTRVVLVSGSVSVTSTEGTEVMLQPGEMAVLVPESEKPTVCQVDIDPYIAWNTGYFTFDNCPLEQLMHVVGRWYGLHVQFNDEHIRQQSFTGDLSKYEDVESTLRAIHRVTGVRIELHEDYVLISE